VIRDLLCVVARHLAHDAATTHLGGRTKCAGACVLPTTDARRRTPIARAAEDRWGIDFRIDQPGATQGPPWAVQGVNEQWKWGWGAQADQLRELHEVDAQRRPERRIEAQMADARGAEPVVGPREGLGHEGVVGVRRFPELGPGVHSCAETAPESGPGARDDHEPARAGQQRRRSQRRGRPRVVCSNPAGRHEVDPGSVQRASDDPVGAHPTVVRIVSISRAEHAARLPFARWQADDAPVRPWLPLLLTAVFTTSAGRVRARIEAPEPGELQSKERSVGADAPDSGQDSMLRQHADDVVDYTFRATLDAGAHTVHGQGRIHWRNVSRRPQDELWIHLYLNAFKNERSAYLRERVGGRGSIEPSDWGWIDLNRLSIVESDGSATDLLSTLELRRPGDDDETDARVPLHRVVAPGEAIDLDVEFDDKLPPIIERTGYRGSFHMVGQWFPKIARLEADGTWAHFAFHHLSEFYADFGAYDVTLDVPSNFIVGATGPVVESRIDGVRRVERHVQGDIHDFAWAAWDRCRTRSERIDGVDVRILFPPGFDGVAERDLTAIRFALPYDSQHYGRYPYSVLTVVHPQEDASEAGGMEYPTLITTEGPWWTPSPIHVPEIVTVHELGHQWFYGLVATNEAAWPFLDEGVNQYVETDVMQQWRGDGSALDWMGLRISDAALQAIEGEPAVHDEPVAQPAAAFSTGDNYARLVYARTAAVLATMARTYGPDAIAKALGVYARRYRFEHPGPMDLLGVFAEVLGERPAATLRAALFDEGWVDYVVAIVSSRRAQEVAGVFDRDGKRETRTRRNADSWEGSVLLRRRGTIGFPVDIELRDASGSTRREHWNGEGESLRIPWQEPVPLASAVVDPDDRVLVDANLENNRASSPCSSRFALLTLERITYWMQLAVQAVSP